MRLTFLIIIYILFSFQFNVSAQEPASNKDTIVEAAKELIGSTKYCVLITLDQAGYPQARTMETLPPDENFMVWFGTNKNSHKVAEIKNDPRVTIHYGDTSGNGYVVLKGMAEIINDPAAKEKHWMDHWDQFYPDREATYTLIKVFPHQLEVVSYKHGLTGDPITWEAPSVDLNKAMK